MQTPGRSFTWFTFQPALEEDNYNQDIVTRTLLRAFTSSSKMRPHPDAFSSPETCRQGKPDQFARAGSFLA